MSRITSERLRQDSGYIGRIIHLFGVKYVQVSRSPAVGMIVCTGLDENDEPKIGWALISPDEPYVLTSKENVLKGNPGISWSAAKEIATYRANKFKNGQPSDENPGLPSNLNSQVKHFKERCKAYFKPEVYSKKSQKRPGSLLKVWVDDTDKTTDTDFTKNMNIN